MLAVNHSWQHQVKSMNKIFPLKYKRVEIILIIINNMYGHLLWTVALAIDNGWPITDYDIQ